MIFIIQFNFLILNLTYLNQSMVNLKKIGITTVILISCNFIQAQTDEQHDQEKHTSESNHAESHDAHKKHVISASINHTVIFGGIKDGDVKSITLPSFGLNYTYFFNHKWAIGLHNDIILEDFVVKESSTYQTRSTSEGVETTVIERGTPIAACIVGIYKPLPYLGLMAGFGREFSSHEDYNVIRLGLEAPFLLPNNWEVFGIVSYDIMIDAYESLTYGIGVAKLF